MISLQLKAPLDRFELDVSIDTDARVLGIFGASGAGKSSLLEIVAGVRAARGRVGIGDQTWLDTEAGVHLPMAARWPMTTCTCRRRRAAAVGCRKTASSFHGSPFVRIFWLVRREPARPTKIPSACSRRWRRPCGSRRCCIAT